MAAASSGPEVNDRSGAGIAAGQPPYRPHEIITARDLSAIRERVKALQGEIAELRTANENYLSKYHHTPLGTR
jgi:hypothetical protein